MMTGLSYVLLTYLKKFIVESGVLLFYGQISVEVFGLGSVIKDLFGLIVILGRHFMVTQAF